MGRTGRRCVIILSYKRFGWTRTVQALSSDFFLRAEQQMDNVRIIEKH